MAQDCLMHTYARLPVSFEKGSGAWLWDAGGRRYLDGVSGVGVCGLGHAHPALAAALCEQAGRLWHSSNLYGIAHQEALAARLCELAGMARVFFCNSGAEANEAALKLARLHARGRGVDEPAVVVMEGSFHGRTLATLSASGSRKVQAGFEPLVRGFKRVPYDDLDAVRRVAAHGPEVVAVLVEPVLGEGGVVVPSPGYLRGLREICDAQGWLLMLDEVQTGMCRTGRWFACQHEDVRPDVLTLAKGLGNGFPVGACLARGAAAELMQPGHHGSTFGGNPLACRVGLAVVEALAAAGLPARAAAAGTRLRAGLEAALAGHPRLRAVRGLGMMVGIELDAPCGDLPARALGQGVLVNCTAGNVLRLLPPLVLEDDEVDELVRRVAAVLDGWEG